MITCRSYISDHWQAQNSTKPLELHNPADLNEVIGEVEFADTSLVVSAMDAAQKAWNGWRKKTVEDRMALLVKLLEKLKEKRDEIAITITVENGKTLRESYSEINSALNEGEYQIRFLRKSIIEHVGNHEIRYEPLGVALLITPWNFPLATILRKLVPALAVGNTVVVKPSEITPMTAVSLFKIIEEIDFPQGVVNLVLGEGSVIGPALVGHSTWRAISLTGSTKTGFTIANQINNRNVRLQAEMGGKNAVVILADANLAEASKAVIQSGFACCGQWCTGTSRVIVDKSVYHSLLQLLVELAKDIVLGNGIDESTTMGPLISKAQLKKVRDAVLNAEIEGAKLMIGGKRPSNPQFFNGYFFEPTIYAGVKPEMNVAQEEIFGPVISVLPAEDADEALSFANKSKYGLAFSVYTQDMETAEKFLDDVNSGVCHVNLPTSFRDPALPLFGWQDSGYGIPESGRFARDFFTRTKAIYRK